MKFYYDLISPPSRAILIFFRLTKLPVQEVAVALRRQEHLTEEFKRNVGPLQRLPVLHDDDGFILSESVAILRYLTTKYQLSVNLYPEDAKTRARVDEYLSWTHNNIRAGVAFFAYATWLRQMDDQESIEVFENRLENVLDEMDQVWLEMNPYLIGDSLTIADVFAVCDIEQIKVVQKEVFEGRPRLKNWYDRVVPRLQPYFNEVHKIIHKYDLQSNNN